MDVKILNFLDNQRNLTLATSFNNIPHCSNCFYNFMKEDYLLVFKSSPNTRHIKESLLNSNVSGTILPDISQPGKIKGIQFSGSFLKPNKVLLEKTQISYYKKYPFALAISGELWAIQLNSITMVDNTLGFGKKLSWHRKDPVSF